MSSLRRREETTSYVYTRPDRKKRYTGEGHYSDPCIYKPSEGKDIQEDTDYIPLPATVG